MEKIPNTGRVGERRPFRLRTSRWKDLGRDGELSASNGGGGEVTSPVWMQE